MDKFMDFIACAVMCMLLGFVFFMLLAMLVASIHDLAIYLSP